MSSGPQDYYDKMQEKAEKEARERLEKDSERLGINPTTLKQLRQFEELFYKHINKLPYGLAKELKDLLDKINTN